MKKQMHYWGCLLLTLFISCQSSSNAPSWVDYVNPYMGNISHLLVPTYPTVHLPHSMLRVYPNRSDYTSTEIKGLPIIVTGHRGSSAFQLSVFADSTLLSTPVVRYTYDNEHVTPYAYDVFLDQEQTQVAFAVAAQSAIYQFENNINGVKYITLNTSKGHLKWKDNALVGYQQLENKTRIYLYLEAKQNAKVALQEEHRLTLSFDELFSQVDVRYGVSFISVDQAKRNLYREQQSSFDLESLKEVGRATWNTTLSAMQVEGSEKDKQVFYTSWYRCLERPINISEDGRYFSAYDHQIHQDEGIPFYVDDWIWDTYRATHPLRVMIDAPREKAIIKSFLRMAKQGGKDWMPTFPLVTGNANIMNSNHAVATILDAYQKGLTDFDLAYAYKASKNAIEEKTLAPWSGVEAGALNRFYKEKGYVPALREGQQETWPEVHDFEKRQPVAVTLGTAYDQWCLATIAKLLGKKEEAAYYEKCAFNYRHLFHPTTAFFHPKDDQGEFITPFDYAFSGGMGAREYYDENNGWVYRWDVPHQIEDLVVLHGGKKQFEKHLDKMYATPLGRNKYAFYAKLPDHTGNVGQFSMANEPSLHIPYLYNYCNAPWKTQKTVYKLVQEWFRNDLMGIPGDEDGGGMSAFVVYSMLGFYPMTPGRPVYTIGTPFFEQAQVRLSNGKYLTIKAPRNSKDAKYIAKVLLNKVEIKEPFISHQQLQQGGELQFVMSKYPHKEWGKAN